MPVQLKITMHTGIVLYTRSIRWIETGQPNAEWKAVWRAKLHFLLQVDNDKDPTLTENTEPHWLCDSNLCSQTNFFPFLFATFCTTFK